MSTYSSPMPTVEPGAQPAPLVGESWGIRAGARVIDTILLVLVSGAAGLIIGVLIGVSAAAAGQSPAEIQGKLGGTPPLAYLFGLIATLIYFTICQTFHGSTPGKIMLGLVVVNEDGTPAGLGANLKREVLYFVDGLVFGLIAYTVMNKSPRKQRIGDQWGHTLVVKRSEVKPEYRREWGTFIVVTLAAVIVATAINLLPTLLRLF